MEIASIIISSLALLVAVYSAWNSKSNAKKQQEFEIRMEQQRIEREKQSVQNRQKAKCIAKSSPLATLAGVQKEIEEETFLKLESGEM